MRRVPIVMAAAAIVVVGWAMQGGCRKASRPSDRTMRGNPERDREIHNELFDIAIESLRHVERFEGEESLYQILDRLNQWLQTQKPAADWKVDPLAEPVLKSLTELSEKIVPIEKELQPARHLLEVKVRARQFAPLPPQLEAARTRVDVKKIEELASRQEEAIRQIEAASKQWDDPARLAEVEARLPEIYSSEVRDKAKLTRLQELIAVARSLDQPSRLRDANFLGRLAEQIENFCRDRDPKELKEIAKQFSEIVTRRLGPAGRTRLVVQMDFLAGQLDETAAWKDLAGMRITRQVLGNHIQQLKTAGEQSGRDDIRKLAADMEAATKRFDLQELAELIRRLGALAKPGTLDDVVDLPQRLEKAAKGLARAAEGLDQGANRPGMGNLREVGAYCRYLGAELEKLAAKLQPPAAPGKPGAPAQPAADLPALTDALLDLTGRLEMLVRQISYFAGLGELKFPRIDVASLEEAVVTRDLSRWARGDEADDVSRAKRLFDWTVRNIQLEPDQVEFQGKTTIHVMQLPWETLFFGRGTSMERAWVFATLARQQGLETGLLVFEDAPAGGGGRLRPWALGVLSEGDIYVFDPLLGSPLPSPKGLRLDESGQLDVQPATLAQLAADDGLLRKLDLGPDRPYPVKAADLRKVVVLVDISPWWLSQRMRLVESRLAGQDRMVLYTSPAASAERWKACKGVADVRPWPVAFDTVFQRMLLGPDVSTWQLGTMAPFVARPATRSPSAPQTTEDRPAPMFWEMNPDVAAQQTRARRSSTEERDEHVASSPLKAGRMLHLCGQFLGQPSATGYYQMVRLSDRQLAELSEGQGEQQVAVLRLAKLCATYWLGLLAFEQRNYASARDYLLARTLETTPRSPWYSGAKYNLGRVYEAEKQYAKAIQQYRGNTEAVDSFGNRLRARWLETLAKPADLEKAPGPATGKGKDQTSETPDLPGLPDLPAMPEGPGAKKKPEPPAKKTEATPKKSDAPAKKPDTEAKKTEAPTKKADTEAKKTEVPSGKR
jgi:hypothetical protein